MCSFPTRNRKFQKNSKKIQKIRKNHHSFFSSQKRMGKAEKEKKVGIENSKKIEKKFKNLENTIIASFQAKIGWKRP